MRERRLDDLFAILAGAIVATASICAWYDRLLAPVAACLAVLAALLIRFHDAHDLAGLAVGATIGNAIEIACDAAGIWIHASRTVLDLAPPYIFVCYPILGLAMPRLIDALGAQRRDEAGGVAVAAPLLLSLVALSMHFGRDNVAQSVVCGVVMLLTLTAFHSRRDLAAAMGGAVLAMVWEIPATVSGAWRFPAPQLFGLVPFWLPAAYAVFFVTLDRITVSLAGTRCRGLATSPQA